jgi:phosphate transport system substrate-binding protein
MALSDVITPSQQEDKKNVVHQRTAGNIARQRPADNFAQHEITNNFVRHEIPNNAVRHEVVNNAARHETPSHGVRQRKMNNIVHVISFAVVVVLLIVVAVDKNWIHAVQGTNAAERNDAPNAILRLAGANTIGDTLAPSLAEAFFRAEGASNVRILPGSNPQEKIIEGVMPGDSADSSITVAAHGSSTAFTSLADNSCDIGMSSRRIKPDETAKLATVGDMKSAASEHILGLDGIAVIVNTSNRLTSLRKDEIRRIFTGEITDWSQVGSPHGEIKIYASDDNSGTYDTFKNLVLGGRPLAPSARRFEDNNALSEAVSEDSNGIGFTGFAFIHNAKSIAVADKGTGTLQPTRLTVATEEYLLSRRLYLYTPAIARNRYTQKFIQFALSQQGQNVLASNGFVAQSVVPVKQAVAPTAPDEYKFLTQNAERLPLDFRFQSENSEQDNKAKVDLDRVVALIADQGGAGDKILLFGFSDNAASAEGNQVLSLNQAKIVENQLIQRGIKPTVVRGFGSVFPVAPNDTQEGREKNRRVEIWIQK